MSLNAIAGLCSKDKLEFEQVFKDTLDTNTLKEARQQVAYKRYLPKDERARRKELLNSKINEIELNSSCTEKKEYQQIEGSILVGGVVNSTKVFEKPELPEDAPIAIILFAGGGGVEAGMVQAGIRPVISVEMDPDKPELSDRIIEVHEANFSEYGTKVIRKTVQQVAAEEFEGFPRNPDYLHSSNVCKNFSNAKGVRKEDREQPEDIETAIATAEAIKVLQPQNFTLEQVPGFKDCKSFDIIYDCLEEQGYAIECGTINLADYGVPQARHRLVLRAGKGAVIPLPPIVERVGWYEAIKDLIPDMEESTLVPGQVKAIQELDNKNQYILIDRIGARNEYRLRLADQPCLTLTRSIFTDGKQSNRNKFYDVVLPDGSCKNLSIRAAARLQSFPDWYELPENKTAIAGTVIGNAVPPLFAAKLFSQKPIPAVKPQIEKPKILFGDALGNPFQGYRTQPYKLPTLTFNNPTEKELEFSKLYDRYSEALAKVSQVISQLGSMSEEIKFAIFTPKPNDDYQGGMEVPPQEGLKVLEVRDDKALVISLGGLKPEEWVSSAELVPCRTLAVYDHFVEIRNIAVSLQSKVEKAFQLLQSGSVAKTNEVTPDLPNVETAQLEPETLETTGTTATIEVDGKTYLLIEALALDEETQSRVEINSQTVEEYKRDRLDGAVFPPITAFFDGKTYHLGDGWHRTLAEKQAGNLRVHANIREGSKRDAKLYSCAANANHGLRRTTADKRKAVFTLLKDDEWTQWSNREIARRCGVDESMVRKYRTELIGNGAVLPQEKIKFQRNGEAQTQRSKSKEVFPRPVVISSDCPVEAIRGQSAMATCRPNNENMIVDVAGERISVPLKFVAEVVPQVKPINSVNAENKVAARSLGLKDGRSVLPEVERNEGVEVNFEAIAKLQAAINCISENQEFLTSAQTVSLIGLIKFTHLSKKEQQKIKIQLEHGGENGNIEAVA